MRSLELKGGNDAPNAAPNSLGPDRLAATQYRAGSAADLTYDSCEAIDVDSQAFEDWGEARRNRPSLAFANYLA